MKKFIVIFLVFFLIAFSGNLYAKKKGARIVVQKLQGQQIRGLLHSVKENSLLLIDPVSWATTSVEIHDIDFIKIVREAKHEWFIWGSLIGGSGGAIIGLSVRDRGDLSRDWLTFYSGAIGLGIGAIIGGGIGTLVGIDRKIRIAGKSPEEIKKILEELRKNAIVKNYQ